MNHLLYCVLILMMFVSEAKLLKSGDTTAEDARCTIDLYNPLYCHFKDCELHFTILTYYVAITDH